MRRRVLLVSLVATVAAACTDAAARRPGVSATVPAAPDPLLADPPREVWPRAYRSAPEPTREAYRYAIERPDILQWMPCFCGCVAQGHESNVDCFVRTRLADGRVVLDPHGFG